MQVEKLRLDSGAFRSQQAAGCAAASHIDDEGVAALVDAFCKRRGSGAGAPPLHPHRFQLCTMDVMDAHLCNGRTV